MPNRWALFKVLLQCRGLLRHWLGHMLNWQISVTIVLFGDQEEGWTEWIQNLCTVVMTHNDLCTCIAMKKWDGPVACVNVTENVEKFSSKCYHFSATKTSVRVLVKQHEHDRVTRCTFSIDFKEMKTLWQALPSTCRRDWNASAIWNDEFSNKNLEIIFRKMCDIPDRQIRNDA